jgi:hypothetical protein
MSSSESAPSRPPERPQSQAERRSRDFERLRGLQLLLESVAGASIPQLAAKYAISEATIGEALNEAWRSDALKSLEARIFLELAPMVLAVYEAQLKLGNLDAARDIAYSLGLLKKPNTTPQKQVAAVVAPQINTIDDYRLAKQQRVYRAPRQINPADD